MLTAIGICVSALGTIGFLGFLARRAPEGWEDENGFHQMPPRPQTRATPALTTASAFFSRSDRSHGATSPAFR